MQTTQVYQLFIKATPERIWEAITKPELIARYFYGAMRRRPAVDGRPLARLDARSLAAAGATARSSSSTRRAGSCTAGGRSTTPSCAVEDESRVTWEIEPQDGGYSKLTVVHDRLEGAPKTAASVAGGWMLMLSGLKTLVETGEPIVDFAQA